MNIDFWKTRWLEKQTGFHLDKVNPCLTTYWPALEIDKGATVFVPLCGKSLDLIWLASQGFRVLGVECSELAIQQFMSENRLHYQHEIYGNYNTFSTSSIDLLQGDYFFLEKSHLKNVVAVYDRAALVAMPVEMRTRYVDLQLSLLPDHASILLVTLEYDQSLMSGPPFSVTQQEVMELYKEVFEITLLSRNNIINDELRFKQRGLDYLIESVYLIKHK